MKSEEIKQIILSEYLDYADDILLADGFDEAFIGIVKGAGHEPKACYDQDKCIKILMEEGLSEEDAVDHFDYIIGSYVGSFSPMFLYTRIIK